MTTNRPRVSVLTPIYNTPPQHLRECIESILNQTFTDFEFLILNDSPDNTTIENIVKEYAEKDSRVHYLKNNSNVGISASRNKLLGLARGEYVAIFDHDDISMPTRLEKQVAYLDANPDVGVVSGLLQYFGVSNDILQNPEHNTDIMISLTYRCAVAHTAAMIRKSVLTDNGIQYEQAFTPAEDYRLWARLMGVTLFHNIQEALVKYRWLPQNTSYKHRDIIQVPHRAIRLDIINRFPAYYRAWCRSDKNNVTLFRVRLFGIIPILKIKRNRVLLFETIPIFKLKWN